MNLDNVGVCDVNSVDMFDSFCGFVSLPDDSAMAEVVVTYYG